MKYLVACLFIVFLAGYINAYSALDFVSQKNGLLKEGESVNSFIEITHSKKQFYVLPVFSNETITGYIILKKKEKNFEDNPETVQALLKTAVFLNDYVEFKNSFVENSSVSWILLDSRKAENIPSFLEQEKIELNVIAGELKESEDLETISELKEKIDLLSGLFSDIGLKMSELNKFETNFLAFPETGKEQEFFSMFNKLFEKIRVLDKKAIEYNSVLKKLQTRISTSNLSVESKKSLLNLSSMPSDFFIAGKWASQEADFSTALNEIMLKAKTKSAVYYQEFITRLERFSAYTELFGENPKIKNVFGNKFDSVKSAANYFLDPTKKNKWKNQNAVKSLESNIEKALNFFEESNYSDSKQFTRLSVKDIIAINQSGLKETKKRLSQQNFYMQTAGILFIILLIIFVLRNYKKFLHKEGYE